MIKNIVFDLGNVLISFNPSGFLDKEGYSSEKKNIILNDIFRSQEWMRIDKGEITTSEAMDLISAKSSLNKDEIASFFDLRIKILYPLKENIKILPALKKRGYKLYFLSNFPDDVFDEIYFGNAFFKNFSGGLISARVKAAKPDREIFEIFLEKYSLLPDECLFIDDLEINVQTAKSIGMKAIWLYDTHDLKHLIEEELHSVSH
jgi:epoxide hydrolase-like predicted phosphatase